jgi:hypothetical protein
VTWDQLLLIVLAAVDVAALAVGLTILRRVTRIVIDTGEAIDRAVHESIEEAKHDAVRGFTEALGPALAVLASQVPKVVREAVGNLHIRAGGSLLVADDTYTGDGDIGAGGATCTSPDGGG